MEPKSTLHYVEAFNHLELIYRWAEVWESIPELRVICYVSDSKSVELGANLKHVDNVKISGKPAEKSWSKYLKAQRFHREDSIVVGTVGRRPDWFRVVANHPRLYIIVHNVGYWSGDLIPWAALSHPRNFGQWIRDFAVLRYKKTFLRNTRQFLVPTKEMKSALSKVISGDRVNILPFAARGQLKKAAKEETVNLVVPGTVDGSNKDYPRLFEELSLLKINEKPIVVYLAGMVKDWDVIRQSRSKFKTVECNQEADDRLNKILIVFFEHGISQPDYDELLLRADIIVAPLIPDFSYGNYKERTGFTRVSGAVFDAVAANCPIILPEWYPEFNSGNEKFTSITTTLLEEVSSGEFEDQGELWNEYKVPKIRSIWKSIVE